MGKTKQDKEKERDRDRKSNGKRRNKDNCEGNMIDGTGGAVRQCAQVESIWSQFGASSSVLHQNSKYKSTT